MAMARWLADGAWQLAHGVPPRSPVQPFALSYEALPQPSPPQPCHPPPIHHISRSSQQLQQPPPPPYFGLPELSSQSTPAQPRRDGRGARGAVNASSSVPQTLLAKKSLHSAEPPDPLRRSGRQHLVPRRAKPPRPPTTIPPSKHGDVRAKIVSPYVRLTHHLTKPSTGRIVGVKTLPRSPSTRAAVCTGNARFLGGSACSCSPRYLSTRNLRTPGRKKDACCCCGMRMSVCFLPDHPRLSHGPFHWAGGVADASPQEAAGPSFNLTSSNGWPAKVEIHTWRGGSGENRGSGGITALWLDTRSTVLVTHHSSSTVSRNRDGLLGGFQSLSRSGELDVYLSHMMPPKRTSGPSLYPSSTDYTSMVAIVPGREA